MPKDEYISAGGGLKLKGAKSSGVDKKRKKTKKPKADIETPTNEATSAAGEDGQDSALTTQQDNSALERQLAAEERQMTKTESERKHEEMRRKRLDERSKREGVKTHKERVEELNKYLSTLSEHHDMPRIGPG